VGERVPLCAPGTVDGLITLVAIRFTSVRSSSS
jgi:hypothetical protein